MAKTFLILLFTILLSIYFTLFLLYYFNFHFKQLEISHQNVPISSKNKQFPKLLDQLSSSNDSITFLISFFTKSVEGRKLLCKRLETEFRKELETIYAEMKVAYQNHPEMKDTFLTILRRSGASKDDCQTILNLQTLSNNLWNRIGKGVNKQRKRGNKLLNPSLKKKIIKWVNVSFILKQYESSQRKLIKDTDHLIQVLQSKFDDYSESHDQYQTFIIKKRSLY